MTLGPPPETFSLLYSWVLLQKSNRTPKDVEDAMRHAKTAIELAEDEYLRAVAHHNLALAYVAAGTSDPDLEWQRLAIIQQWLAIEHMPEHIITGYDSPQFLRVAVVGR